MYVCEGYIGQIARDVPFRAIQLPSYELAKKWYSTLVAFSQLRCAVFTYIHTYNAITTIIFPSPLENLLVGIIAGSFAAALTTPLDVLKTRMMTAKGKMAGDNSVLAVLAL